MTFFQKLRGFLYQCTPAGQRDVRECRRLNAEMMLLKRLGDRMRDEAVAFRQKHGTGTRELEDRYCDLMRDSRRYLGLRNECLIEWRVVAARIGIDPV